MLLHSKDVIDMVFSRICQVIDADSIRVHFVNTDIVVNEQRPEAVLSHQRIIFQNTHLRELCKLFRGTEDATGKLSAYGIPTSVR